MVVEKAELWVSLNVVLRNAESESCMERFNIWVNGQVLIDVKVTAMLEHEFQRPELLLVQCY